MLDEYEQIIFNVISNAGGARSDALNAMTLARKGQLAEAEKKLADARKSISKAHQIQTDLLQKEVNGVHTPVTLIMVHAQDHLMNAITVIDLVTEFIAYIKEGK